MLWKINNNINILKAMVMTNQTKVIEKRILNLKIRIIIAKILAIAKRNHQLIK